MAHVAELRPDLEQRGLQPEIALTALDSDVIKSYVALGLGVGIVSSMAVARARQEGLVAIDAAHLFPTQVTRLAFKRGAYLRNFVFRFAELLSDRLDRNLIAKAMSGHGTDFDM
mgnify:CR=1 FL=1